MKKAEYVKAILALADAGNSLFAENFLNSKGKLSPKKIAEHYNVNKKTIKFCLEVRDAICKIKHI